MRRNLSRTPDKNLMAVMKDLKLSRRQMLAALSVGGATAGVAACGSPTAASGDGDGDPNVRSEFSQADINVPSEYSDRTPVLFWVPLGDHIYEAIDARRTAFNEEQDEIYVGIEHVGTYEDLNTQFTAAIQARQVPDIVLFPEMQWMQFYLSDNLAVLDEYFDDEWNMELYLDQYLDETRAGDETICIPFARSNPLFYYNRTLFEELGLPPEGPSTWEEFAEMGPEFEGAEVAGQSVSPFAFASDAWFPNSHVWAWGGQWSEELEVTADSDPVREWLTFKAEFIHDDHYGYLAQESTNDFVSGLAACVMASTASLAGLTADADFELGATYLLGHDDAGPPVPNGGSAFQMVKTESKERQNAVAEFFRFLSRPEQAAQYHLDTGYVPITHEAVEHELTQDNIDEDPNFGIAMDQIENAQIVDPAMWFTSGTQAVAQAVGEVYGDNAEVDAVVGRLQSELESVIDDNREGLEEVLSV